MIFPYGKQDLLKIGRGFAIALAGAALTYLTSVISHTDFGIYSPLIMTLTSTFVAAGVKALDGVKE